MKGIETRYKGSLATSETCPVCGHCPVGAVCGRGGADGDDPLYPTVEDVEQGELVWSDPRYGQQVHLVRKGVFACMPNFDHDAEIVTSIYGPGFSIGLAELYIPPSVSGTYHLHALTDGRLCSFPAKALRRRLESLPLHDSQGILACALTNIVEAGCVQLRMVAKTSLQGRVALLFARLRSIAACQGEVLDEIHLTHREIAELVASDRASVTRALRALNQEGLIELGYKSIALTERFARYADSCADVYANFQVPNQRWPRQG